MKNNTFKAFFGKSTSPEDILKHFSSPQLTYEERLALGKSSREKTPRGKHAEFKPLKDRPDPIGILKEQAKTRLPQLIPIRHARMLSNPYAFYRGTAAIMAADLQGTPSTDIMVQACGDMHLSNFGVYASAERQLVFGINDFDETHKGAWEWDLKRLAGSAAVAARYLGVKEKDQEMAAQVVSEGYRKNMRTYAKMGYISTWYSTITEEALLKTLSLEVRKNAVKLMQKARNNTHLQVLDKMTELVDNKQRIIEKIPFVVRETHSASGRPIVELLDEFLIAYIDSLSYDRRELLGKYRIVDVARKVVGVGSVGTRCWVIMMRGANEDDPLFIQIKEAQPSVLERFFPGTMTFKSNGHRVVIGQRIIQGSPDIFLGWGIIEGIHFYVRQLRDMKGSTDVEPGKTKFGDFLEYCSLCGWSLSQAHAKGGDAAVITGYMGKSEEFDDAIGRFALSYADQNDRDYEQMIKAAKRGDIQVATGD